MGKRKGHLGDWRTKRVIMGTAILYFKCPGKISLRS